MSATPPRVGHVFVPRSVSRTPPRLGDVVHRRSGRTMGTTWSVAVVGPPSLDGEAIERAVQAELDDVVAQASPWERQSVLSRLNRTPVGLWQAVPMRLAAILQAAQAVANASHGAFDATAGALVDLWGFGPPGPVSRAPTAEAIAAARRAVGWRGLSVAAADASSEHDEASDPSSSTTPRDVGARVRRTTDHRLDLSAIAKGHGVDAVSRRLGELGHDSHLVEVGGELRGEGLKPDGQPWWVSLADPPDLPDGVTRSWTAANGRHRVALHGLAVATSGDYLRGFRDDATWRPHTIDPRTGWPVTHGLASVSVLAPTCMAADAWSTALMVLGVEAGLALATREGLAALFVARVPAAEGGGWREMLSPALRDLSE